MQAFLERLYAQLDDYSATELVENDAEIARTLRHLVADQVDHKSTSFAMQVDCVIKNAFEQMSSATCTASFFWRKLYTDACISKALVLVLTSEHLHESVARTSIATLDQAIVLAGAPGASLELIVDMIKWIQSNALWQDYILPSRKYELTTAHHVVQRPSSAIGSVPCITPPSLMAFQNRWCHSPFVLKGYVTEWPAVKQWISEDYLYSVAGPGRIVPVEIGSDYRSDDWTQKLLGWEEFLSTLSGQNTNPGQVLYLAQHNLLKQFPALMEDIIVPDYAYMSPGPSASYPTYKAPSNEDQLVINVWFGPKGTTSPAHTDPFFNCYGKIIGRPCSEVIPDSSLAEAQVVGRKTVWLSPPEVETFMYPYGSSQTAMNDGAHHPAANTVEPLMSNTSQVDVFPVSVVASRERHRAFWDEVPEKALSVTLEPGDLLIFPPGWWHAMRSEDVSFSVSMWF